MLVSRSLKCAQKKVKQNYTNICMDCGKEANVCIACMEPSEELTL
jgi:hypothetical protein